MGCFSVSLGATQALERPEGTKEGHSQSAMPGGGKGHELVGVMMLDVAFEIISCPGL